MNETGQPELFFVSSPVNPPAEVQIITPLLQLTNHQLARLILWLTGNEGLEFPKIARIGKEMSLYLQRRAYKIEQDPGSKRAGCILFLNEESVE